MSEITRGVMGMPYEMAMASEYSRRQFYNMAVAIYASHVKISDKIISLVEENESLRADAERYRWLRTADWWRDPVCVIRNPKEQAKLGSDCPSGERLDAAIDSAISSPENP